MINKKWAANLFSPRGGSKYYHVIVVYGAGQCQSLKHEMTHDLFKGSDLFRNIKSAPKETIEADKSQFILIEQKMNDPKFC